MCTVAWCGKKWPTTTIPFLLKISLSYWSQFIFSESEVAFFELDDGWLVTLGFCSQKRSCTKENDYNILKYLPLSDVIGLLQCLLSLSSVKTFGYFKMYFHCSLSAGLKQCLSRNFTEFLLAWKNNSLSVNMLGHLTKAEIRTGREEYLHSQVARIPIVSRWTKGSWPSKNVRLACKTWTSK